MSLIAKTIRVAQTREEKDQAKETEAQKIKIEVERETIQSTERETRTIREARGQRIRNLETAGQKIKGTKDQEIEEKMIKIEIEEIGKGLTRGKETNLNKDLETEIRKITQEKRGIRIETRIKTDQKIQKIITDPRIGEKAIGTKTKMGKTRIRPRKKIETCQTQSKRRKSRQNACLQN